MRKQKGNVLVIVLVLLLLVTSFVAIFVLMQNQELRRQKDNSDLEVKNTGTKIPTVISTNPLPTKKENGGIYVYKILVKSSKGFDPQPLSLSVQETTGDNDLRIFHDKTFNTEANSNYFFVVSSKVVTEMIKKSVTTTGDYQITFVSDENQLLPYLSDGRYCKVDGDCTDKMSFCTTGSYNQYHRWMTYGCEGSLGVEDYSENQIKSLTKDCMVSEIDGGPLYDATFTKAKCVESRCTAQDMKITCSK